ncbi:hypothetical protein [Pseudoduganella violaceinigra]|uniref:hypothetical protein n=1 Tax=Pseudoduganella violaceinigra TaxID=246602 RepID=UPI00048734ED|nr:hypothetical protein [Pseudoduganella violaceinigra]
MSKPLMEFDGCLCDQGEYVVLQGIFHMPFRAKCQLSCVLSLLTLFVVLASRDVIFNHNLEAAGGIVFSLAIAAFVVAIFKIKTKDSLSVVKWLASSIKIALLEATPATGRV